MLFNLGAEINDTLLILTTLAGMEPAAQCSLQAMHGHLIASDDEVKIVGAEHHLVLVVSTVQSTSPVNPTSRGTNACL